MFEKRIQYPHIWSWIIFTSWFFLSNYVIVTSRNPSNFRIEILALRIHLFTLGSKGLKLKCLCNLHSQEKRSLLPLRERIVIKLSQFSTYQQQFTNQVRCCSTYQENRSLTNKKIVSNLAQISLLYQQQFINQVR